MVRDRVVQLTPEGRQRLADELENLRGVKLPELTTRIQDANEHGDISDNSEYEELKEELVLTDARIHELEFLLDKAEEIEPPAKGVVGLGSSVTIRSDDGEEDTWRLVSPQEADTRVGAISTDSPVGHALMGRKVGDSTSVETPAGVLNYTIVKVS
ncbi:MAG: transcription elongation factor GreA [Thermomicrobiales bacterium]|nr:transcription elongation factor GreA [Thermomicrobiales bacterium]